jgi:type I site-specific restriction-modification system R (restriction) subunit
VKPTQAEGADLVQRNRVTHRLLANGVTIEYRTPAGDIRGARPGPWRNIVVIADEAHRSKCDFIDGFARHMRDVLPHAPFIGFTETSL